MIYDANAKRCTAVMVSAPDLEYIVDMVYWEHESTYYISNIIPLPKGSIKKLIGYELKANEEPVKLKEE